LRDELAVAKKAEHLVTEDELGLVGVDELGASLLALAKGLAPLDGEREGESRFEIRRTALDVGAHPRLGGDPESEVERG
jgi:uncharacterized small protein (DUF1192 family)